MPLSGEAKLAYQREWIRKRREAWIQENGPCAKCGSSEDLQCDHVDPKEKELEPAALWGMSPKNPKRVVELAKCQVLCYSCHREKSNDELREWNTKPIMHGTVSAYFHKGCRCVACKRAYSKYRHERYVKTAA